MQPTRRSDLSTLIKFFSNTLYLAQPSACRSFVLIGHAPDSGAWWNTIKNAA